MAELVTIARPYAAACFGHARDRGALDAWSGMLELLVAVYRDPSVQAVLQDPNLTRAGLERTLLAIGGDKLDGPARNLVSLLVRNDRLEALPAIRDLFEQLKAELQLSRGFVLARADRGMYYEAERRLDVFGNVQIFDPSGYEIRGESGIVNLRDSLVLADEPVEAQGPLGIIHGNAAAVSEKGQHIFLYRGVKATLYPNTRGS